MQSLDIEYSSIVGASLDLSKELINSNTFPVVFCVGESGSGAVLSKLMAELLVLKYNTNAYVYGRNKNNITEKNLSKAVAWAKSKHKGSKIILIISKNVEIREDSIVYYGKGRSLVNENVLGDYCYLVGINTNKIWGAKQFSLNKLADKTARIVNNGILYSNVLKDCNKKNNLNIV